MNVTLTAYYPDYDSDNGYEDVAGKRLRTLQVGIHKLFLQKSGSTKLVCKDREAIYLYYAVFKVVKFSYNFPTVFNK